MLALAAVSNALLSAARYAPAAGGVLGLPKRARTSSKGGDRQQIEEAAIQAAVHVPNAARIYLMPTVTKPVADGVASIGTKVTICLRCLKYGLEIEQK